ncbi:hypothetical protein Tco_0156440 [Tanacetum coccineum]
MASFNYRYAITECSSCGALYTRNCGCSKGSLEDKILIPDSSQRPLIFEKNCLNCGVPVHGLYCRQCALIRKTLEEVFQDFQNTSKSSDDDTNFVNENQEPFDTISSVNDVLASLVGKVLIMVIIVHRKFRLSLNRNHATIKPLMSSHRLCQVFTRHPVPEMIIHTYDSKPNFVDDSPNVLNPPPQPPIYSCEFCRNDACYGHYCTPQVPFIYPELCYNQGFNFQQDFHDFQQQYLCCENCGRPHETFECQPLNYYEPNPCYDSNYSGYDQFDNFHPQQYLCCENCGGPQCQPMNEDYYHEQNSCYDPNSFGFDQFLPQPLPVIDPTPLEKGMEELRIAFQA